MVICSLFIDHCLILIISAFILKKACSDYELRYMTQFNKSPKNNFHGPLKRNVSFKVIITPKVIAPNIKTSKKKNKTIRCRSTWDDNELCQVTYKICAVYWNMEKGQQPSPVICNKAVNEINRKYLTQVEKIERAILFAFIN